MASTYLTRTPSSASNRRTCTVSLWVKQDNLTDNRVFFDQGVDGSNFIRFYLDSNNRLAFYIEDSSAGGTQALLKPSALLRDVSAWYHFVIAVDVTQATESNRVKMYINGELQTSFNDSNYPSQNLDIEGLNTTNPVNIGRRVSNNDNYFSGLISHYHFIDGTAYDASDFGSTDSVTGEWKINTSPSVTYGTNGFFILKDGNSVTDQSGEGNDFTVGGGTLTKTEDNPSNVFCVMNALDSNQYQTLSSGNLKIVNSSPASSFGLTKGSIGVTKGKWYWEVKYTYGAAGHFGFFKVSNTAITNEEDINGNLFTVAGSAGNFTGVGFRISGGGDILEIQGNVDTGVDFSSGDTLGLAFDGDSGKLYAFKNGTELTGQNIGAGTSLMSAVTMDDIFLPFISNGDGGSGTKTGTSEVNFGNGYFGTTAVSSAGTNVSGIGIFEYDVPTGYTALSTKGLNL